MAKVLSTRGISFHLEEIIHNSKKEIILISPFLKIPSSLYERLAQSNKKGIPITIVYGKTEIKIEQKKKLEKLDNCRILFKKNLHSKIYLNELSGIICSMNLYDYSENNNTETGVYFKNDNTLYKEMMNEVDIIINNSELKKERKNSTDEIEEGLIIEKIIQRKQKTKIENYPIKNIYMTSVYGIVTYNFKKDVKNLKELYNKKFKYFEKALNKNYRVYWSSPHKKISVYIAEEKEFYNDRDKEKYFTDAIKITNRLIRKYLI